MDAIPDIASRNMQILSEKTYWAKIYQSGPIGVAEQVIRRECFPGGLCVTIEPTKFIFLGGEEMGFVVGLINYPRFPETSESILQKAKDLALKILDETYQSTTLIMTPDDTIWFSKPKIR
jgi:hypothetical protein